MGDGLSAVPPQKKTFAELFEECFPYYLSIGMTYDQYWCDDPTLVKAYRKADELRKQRANQEAWLQGLYFYNALCSASPVINALSKKKEPLPYIDKPLPITKIEQEELRRQQIRKQQEGFAAFAAAMNERRRRRAQNDGY